MAMCISLRLWVEYENSCFIFLNLGVTALYLVFTDYSCAHISTGVWLIVRAIDLSEVLTGAETYSEIDVYGRTCSVCFSFPA